MQRLRTIPLQNLLETVSADRSKGNFSGRITSLDDLLQAKACSALDAKHTGVYAFLAFNTADAAVKEYVELGTLSADTGRKLLVLLSAPSQTKSAAKSVGSIAGVEILDEVDPVYELARAAAGPVSLPGLLIFQRLSEPCEAVFVTFAKQPGKLEVRRSLLDVVRCIDAALTRYMSQSGASFAALLGAELSVSNIDYTRSGPRSFEEWAIGAVRFLRKHAQDIVAVAKILS